MTMANPDGTPIWFELNARDGTRASAFYAAAIGWTVDASPAAEHGGYRIATSPAGEGVAGIATPPPDAPSIPGWSIYFAVADTDQAAARIRSLGGAIAFGPMDIPGVGRFAIATDPQGVAFLIMKGASPEDSTAFKSIPGQIGHGVWIELATPDPDGAIAFYGALFGWTREGAMPMGELGDYVFLGAGEARPGAVMPSHDAPPRWLPYFHVADIDAAVAAAQAQGGALLEGPHPIPGGDFSAHLADPDGSKVGIAGPRKES